MIESCPDETALNDYADRLLPAAECRSLREHLARCAPCSNTTEELRALAERVAALPELPPGRDLLPEIRAAALARRGPRFAWAALAAAVAVVAVAAIALIGRDGAREQEGPGQAAAVSAAASDPELAEAERQFVEAARQLLEVIEQRRGLVPPEWFADFERELAALDRAIGETRELLAQAPERSNGQTLAALYQKKMELLWTVSRLTS